MTVYCFIPNIRLVFISILFFVIHASMSNIDAAEDTEKPKEVQNKKKATEEKDKKEAKEESDKETEKEEDDKDSDKKEEYLKIGNLSLSASQQPGPLVSFGERVLDEGEAQFFILGDALFGKRNYETEIIGSYVYGITDELTIYFDVPYAPANKDGHSRSSGIKDLIVQLEYAFYSESGESWAEQATIVGAILLPTGSLKKDPPTGFGSTSFFMGVTFNHTEFEWLYFGSTGVVLATWHRESKAGNKFLYQGGFGRNICTPPGWIYAWIVEVIGLYTAHNRINGEKDVNLGGNVISIVPSIWISSEKTIFQLGVGYAVVEHLSGDQRKAPYSAYINLGWTF